MHLIFTTETPTVLPLHHVKCSNFECGVGENFHEIFGENKLIPREFILESQRQTAKCDAGDQLRVQLRDQLIAGINLPYLHSEFIQIAKCSFENGRTACINYEAVHEIDFHNIYYPSLLVHYLAVLIRLLVYVTRRDV